MVLLTRRLMLLTVLSTSLSIRRVLHPCGAVIGDDDRVKGGFVGVRADTTGAFVLGDGGDRSRFSSLLPVATVAGCSRGSVPL